MRRAFVAALTTLAETDDRILLLTADLGFSVLESFAEKFPDRFFNVGVAEQNMVGLATGFAEAGYIPFLYSIATFLTLRPYEQFRNGAIYHRLPVRLVGIGGGFEYGHDGITHFALEDFGIMRVQPGVTVLAPADPAQAVTMLRKTYQLHAPIYYRIGKDDNTIVPGLNGQFSLGTVDLVREGHDLLILSVGNVSSEAVAAADILSGEMHTSTAVGVVATLNPAPVDALESLLHRFSQVVTLESHYRNGGLGSLVAEVIADGGIPCRLKRLGVDTMPAGRTGSETFMNTTHGLTRQAIVQTVLQMMR